MSRPPVLLTERISGLHYQHNAQTLGFTRTSTSVLAGCVAGVLGLTGFYGFLFYFLSILLAAAVWLYRLDFDAKVASHTAHTAVPVTVDDTALIARLTVIACGMRHCCCVRVCQPYFSHWHHLVSDGLMSGLMTYVLFWTLMYDIVYIY